VRSSVSGQSHWLALLQVPKDWSALPDVQPEALKAAQGDLPKVRIDSARCLAQCCLALSIPAVANMPAEYASTQHSQHSRYCHACLLPDLHL
jgi:hypothetical protein